ncbi:MAG: tRNA epoxyqueuosine(34) reductase QueG [Candidatus Aphodosoma sp.]
MEQYIKSLALNYGFSACGIAQLTDIRPAAEKFSYWLDAGFNANMKYMKENMELRINPALLLEGAKSAIVVLLNYFPRQDIIQKKYRIASYAFGMDYHYVVRSKLQSMAQNITEKFGISDKSFAPFADSAPLFDRYWAWKAGLGWIGKSGMLVNPDIGSFTFIGVMLTTLSLKPDTPIADRCGNCNACVKACPTGAISADMPGVLNANKCLSYLTIECRDELPNEIVPLADNILFGCEKCLSACPWNKFATPHNVPELMPIAGIFDVDWCNATNSIFRKQLKYSAMKRAGARKLRNRALQIENLIPNCICSDYTLQK